VHQIASRIKPEKIILFGSYAEGNYTEESDVDLLIIFETDRKTTEVSVDISLMIKHTFPIDIIVKTPQEIEKRRCAGDFFINQIINNGIVLYERISYGMD